MHRITCARGGGNRQTCRLQQREVQAVAMGALTTATSGSGCVVGSDTCGEAEIVVDGCVVNAGDEGAGASECACACEVDGYSGADNV